MIATYMPSAWEARAPGTRANTYTALREMADGGRAGPARIRGGGCGSRSRRRRRLGR